MRIWTVLWIFAHYKDLIIIIIIYYYYLHSNKNIIIKRNLKRLTSRCCKTAILLEFAETIYTPQYKFVWVLLVFAFVQMKQAADTM